ncbi:inosine triphosphate pyrophosphatase-like protein [Entophlyctis helioformis]|nr:inosine triphosphate pyrophosphatase-like protein [Entophlyctis helioformis]
MQIDYSVQVPALPIVLGSSSKFRAQILRDAGLAFTTLSPDIDEKAIGGEHRQPSAPGASGPDPSALTLEIANAKADALVRQAKAGSSGTGTNSDESGVLLIACDEVVAYRGQVREKPESEDECRAFLKSYAAYPVETYSALVVVNTHTGKRVQGVDVARQYMTEIPDDVVDAVLAKGDIMWCAGGVMVDEPLLFPYLGERQGDLDSIIGMPLRLLDRLLREATL